MSSLKYKVENVSKYIIALFLLIKETKHNIFTSEDLTIFLEKNINNQNIINLLSGKPASKFNRSSKTNINYITIFDNEINTIPLECFNLLNRINLEFENEKGFCFCFDNIEDINMFTKWKHIWSINKFIYDSGNGIVRTVIEQAIKDNIISENKQNNKININLNGHSGNKSGATKQYTYLKNIEGITTIINDKYYIDFYDIYNINSGFFDQNTCFVNIITKIKKSAIIKTLEQHNILIDEILLKEKIEINFFKDIE